VDWTNPFRHGSCYGPAFMRCSVSRRCGGRGRRDRAGCPSLRAGHRGLPLTRKPLEGPADRFRNFDLVDDPHVHGWKEFVRRCANVRNDSCGRRPYVRSFNARSTSLGDEVTLRHDRRGGGGAPSGQALSRHLGNRASTDLLVLLVPHVGRRSTRPLLTSQEGIFVHWGALPTSTWIGQTPSVTVPAMAPPASRPGTRTAMAGGSAGTRAGCPSLRAGHRGLPLTCKPLSGPGRTPARDLPMASRRAAMSADDCTGFRSL